MNISLNPCSICSDLYLAKPNKQNSMPFTEQRFQIRCKELGPWKDYNSVWCNTNQMPPPCGATIPIVLCFCSGSRWMSFRGVICKHSLCKPKHVLKGSNVSNINEASFKKRKQVTRSQVAEIRTEKVLSSIHSVQFILMLSDMLVWEGSCFVFYGKNRSGSKLESSPELWC